ncbi:MAG: biotin--[acetyl-CoA-carboxylase] ligase [Deltaproteobacteria bacterium]|nr:biotin--[acetyl-CoA-carboxylase] ligase [Deltaproteobacteria bacterium]MBW1952842.1 biotin--[acetyl-CoA-carboxylase] ligase [Deltaproteobacteria bacterium]MBW1986766.1 biotin--[acetyl-CoA-carboxylase] ligase [Deltaproteobacteria bacterium]MBW2135270.1 biotin--[acetyl-CoA-carboxylase] ligase [Deltaproteobacteria bacterium]
MNQRPPLGSTPDFDPIQQELLGALRQSSDYISGETLAARLGASRTAVWKRLQRLRAAGYQIVGSPRRGYRLEAHPDLLLPAEIARDLDTKFLRGPFYHFFNLSSTNDLAKQLARQGYPEGTVILAESQTAGRGRLGRNWESPPGSGIYVSIILRPALPPVEMPKLTLTAAVAVVQALEQTTGIRVGIKWPNDLIWQEKKLGGILTEMETESDQMSHLVLGLGVNVNTSSFPPALATIATSLAQGGGRFSRLAILRAWLEALDRLYGRFQAREFAPILARWRQAAVSLGKTVTVRQGSGTITGLALDVTPEGALLIQTAVGEIRQVICGEIDPGPLG